MDEDKASPKRLNREHYFASSPLQKPGATQAPSRQRHAADTLRREQLLDEAALQLNSKGISHTSMTDVADALGFSRSSLYYYIKDREDLMFQVYRRSSQVMARHLSEAVKAAPSALLAVRAFVSRALDPTEPELAALSEIGLLNRGERESVLAIHEAVVARLARVLKAGAQSGELRWCDFSVVARVIVSIIHSVPLDIGLATTLKVNRQQIIATALDVLTDGWATNRCEGVDWAMPDLAPLVAGPVDPFDRGAIRQARREKILATASRLFNRRGVDTTSLEDIARELGVTKRTLYARVGDKQTIVSTCCDRSHEIHMHILQQAMRQGRSAAECLVAALRTTVVAQQRDDIEPLRATTGFDSLGAAQRAAAVKVSQQLVRAHLTLFAQAQREGSMRELRLECLLILMRSASAWIAKGLVQADEQRKMRIAAETVDVLRVGLRPT